MSLIPKSQYRRRCGGWWWVYAHLPRGSAGGIHRSRWSGSAGAALQRLTTWHQLLWQSRSQVSRRGTGSGSTRQEVTGAALCRLLDALPWPPALPLQFHAPLPAPGTGAGRCAVPPRTVCGLHPGPAKQIVGCLLRRGAVCVSEAVERVGGGRGQLLLALVLAAPAPALSAALITQGPLLAAGSVSLPLAALCSLLWFAKQSLKFSALFFSLTLTNPGCWTRREGS